MKITKIALPPELDTSVEVIEQTKIITDIMTSLKLDETPSTGTNKQMLQTNNANLEKAKTKLYKLPVSLKITPPTKLSYTPNENINLTGMVVECTFDNGEVKDVTKLCTVSPKSFATEGTHTVTVSYTENTTVTGTFDVKVFNLNLKIVTWADGTDEEIVAMVQAADEGKINLGDYWNVGDERIVNLTGGGAYYSSAFRGGNVLIGEKHVDQTVTMVLMHKGQYQLANGKPCNFVVGQKNCLIEDGAMENDGIIKDAWEGSGKRYWLNSAGYFGGFPKSLKPIFKKFRTATWAARGDDILTITEDYFAFPAEKEVFGDEAPFSRSEEKTFSSLFQFDYYKTASNRIKKQGDTSSNNASWWLRSLYVGPFDDVPEKFCYVSSKPDIGHCRYGQGIAPFGCI